MYWELCLNLCAQKVTSLTCLMGGGTKYGTSVPGLHHSPRARSAWNSARVLEEAEGFCELAYKGIWYSAGNRCSAQGLTVLEEPTVLAPWWLQHCSSKEMRRYSRCFDTVSGDIEMDSIPLQIDKSTDIGHFAQLITLIGLPEDSFLEEQLGSLERSIKTSYWECCIGDGKRAHTSWALDWAWSWCHKLLLGTPAIQGIRCYIGRAALQKVSLLFRIHIKWIWKYWIL